MSPSAMEEPERASLRALLGQVPWTIVFGGLALAYAVGLGLGLLLHPLGWFEHGAAWERAVLVFAHSTVSPWLDPIFLYAPYVGTNWTLVPFVAIGAYWLWRKEYHTVALHLVVVQLGSWFLNPAIKFSVGRPRPELFEQRGQHGFSAFPSGHSIAVTSVLFTVAYLIDRTGHGTWGYWAVAVFFIINQYSRVYLQVHWPTDMIGGTIVGLIWLAATLWAFHGMHERSLKVRA